MQYALLIYTEPGLEKSLPAEERAAIRAEYAELAGDDRFLESARLLPARPATSARVAGGRVLPTDGPFADTKEVFGGFCLVEAADLDEATELAARIPVARVGGVVEVRPVVRS